MTSVKGPEFAGPLCGGVVPSVTPVLDWALHRPQEGQGMTWVQGVCPKLPSQEGWGRKVPCPLHLSQGERK